MEKNQTTTDEIMDFLKEHMVTKEEAKNFATKSDLRAQELRLLDAMDDKLINLKGDLINVIRKEDRKLIELVTILRKRDAINDDDVKQLLALEPFPQSS